MFYTGSRVHGVIRCCFSASLSTDIIGWSGMLGCILIFHTYSTDMGFGKPNDKSRLNEQKFGNASSWDRLPGYAESSELKTG